MTDILIFDLDGTLTDSGQQITKPMISILTELSQYAELVIVGGGTYNNIQEQLTNSINLFTHIFAECGTVHYQNNILISTKNMIDHCNRQTLNLIIKTALYEISQMPIIYSGHQIDFRKGLVYISPPGMQAAQLERQVFINLDKKHNLRQNLIHTLKLLDLEDEFDIVIGGQVGISVYPKNWNKSQIMTYFNTGAKNIHFFGDKTEKDGNDYPLYTYPGVIGYCVKSYHDTIQLLSQFLTKKVDS